MFVLAHLPSSSQGWHGLGGPWGQT